MKYVIYAIFVFAAGGALAQIAPSPPPPDTATMQAGLQILQMQRNRALDDAAAMAVQLAKAQQQIADLKAKCGKPCQDVPQRSK